MSLFLSSLAIQLRRLPMARQIGLSGSKAAGSSSRFLTTSASLPVSFLVTPMPYYSFPTEESWKQLLRRNTDSGVSSVESFRGALRAAGVTIHDAKDRINSFILERKASEGSSTVAKITMANIAVYIMWKLAPAAFMVRFVYS